MTGSVMCRRVSKSAFLSSAGLTTECVTLQLNLFRLQDFCILMFHDLGSNSFSVCWNAVVPVLAHHRRVTASTEAQLLDIFTTSCPLFTFKL